MRAGLALFCRTAKPDLRFYGNKGRAGGICLCSLDGFSDLLQVITVFYCQQLESKGFHAFLHILCECNICGTFNRNLVGIIEHDQLAQAKGPCQRKGFRRNSFHHAAVAAQHIGKVIHNRIIFFIENSSQMSFCHCHAHCHCHTCPQRSCGGFNAYRMAIFGMSRGERAPLAEGRQILPGQPIAKQVQQRIQQR